MHAYAYFVTKNDLNAEDTLVYVYFNSTLARTQLALLKAYTFPD